MYHISPLVWTTPEDSELCAVATGINGEYRIKHPYVSAELWFNDDTVVSTAAGEDALTKLKSAAQAHHIAQLLPFLSVDLTEDPWVLDFLANLEGVNKREVLKQCKPVLALFNCPGFNRWVDDKFFKYEGPADEEDLETLRSSILQAAKQVAEEREAPILIPARLD